MNTLNNASLFVKTVVGFIVSVVFIGFVGYKSVESLDTFAGKADAIFSNDLTGLGVLTVVQMEFLSARVALRDALIASDQGFRDKRLGEFNKHVEVLKDSSRSYLTKLRSEEGKRLYATYETDVAAFEDVGRRIAALLAEGNKDSATVLTLTECVERSDRVKKDLEALLENKQEVSSQARGELLAIPVDLAGDQTLLSVLAAVLSLSVGLFLAAVIVRPVKKLTTAAEAIAGGDLSYAVETNRSKDEIGRLATAFAVMVENLRARVAESNAKGEEAEKAASEAKVLRRNAELAQADLSHSVDEMLASVDRFAQGDLTASVEAEGKDSIRELFDRYNRAIDNVRTMIRTISSQVQVVQTSSLDISQKSSVLATGIEHQSLQVADISSAMMEMNTTITENSRMASAAAQEAQQAKNEAQRGGESLKMMIENVGQVSAVVRNSSAIVSQLGDSSQRIGEIVSVIEEIADQTNLLALNAAIEAARAGEQGRGFAVVADEVRKLAERTQGATKEIGSMIGEIQKNTANAVTAMHTGSELVNAGESHVETARKALEIIIQKSAYVADYITTLATASEQQSATSEEITRSVESITSVVEQSATTTQEIASIAGDLHALTEELNALMLQFKTGDHVSGRLPSRSAALPGRR